jgi:hypothetical protein
MQMLKASWLRYVSCLYPCWVVIRIYNRPILSILILRGSNFETFLVYDITFVINGKILFRTLKMFLSIVENSYRKIY